MNNAVLIQHSYPGPFEKMLELTREHNNTYCNRYDFDYWLETFEKESLPMSQGAWLKIELIQRAMQQGYRDIVWLDADAMIVDVETDLRDAIQHNKIGACWHRIPQLNHWNVGVLYISNTDETRRFVDDWLASYPPPANGWFEQGVFNRMGLQSKTVVTISDKWNATIDVNMVPDAVVLGFHGQGNAEHRYKLMQQTYERLFKVAEHA